MPLSLNEIRERARAFAREWADETSERAEAQSFWNEFFNVFGVNRRRVAVFEQKAARFSGSQHGRIDVFWPGVMLAEHKSEGRDLDAAFEQATDYFAGLKDAELPRFVLVSDFQRFRLHDLETGERTDFPLAELPRQIGRFGFISGYQTRTYKEEDPVNVQAAERMGRLHDALKAAGYDGHALELLLVRLLFCLFADDTGIFPRQSFHELIAQRTREDGSDLGMWLGRIFQVLDTPPEKRQTTLDEQLAELPYVNGRLFEERLPLADFDAPMRALLLDASTLDWSRISPAIFGAMFAPRPFDVAKEMVRVTKAGGRIVMGNWIPGDPTLVAQILRISSAYSPPPPEGFVSPMTWGVDANAIERFEAAGIPSANVTCERDTYTFNYPGPASKFLDQFRNFYGPTMNAFEAAAKTGKDEQLQNELDLLFNRQNQARTNDTTTIPASFLRVTVRLP